MSSPALSLPAISAADSRSVIIARRRLIIGRVLSYLALGIAVLLVLFPIYWMIITSLKLPREIYRVPSLWPQTFTLDNYSKLLSDGTFLLAIRNSFIVSSMVTVISVFISSFAAYSMVRFRYRFRGFFGRLILFAYLTPSSLLFIPLSIVMAQLHLGNSPDRADLRLPYLLAAAFDLAAAGVFPRRAARARGAGDDRRALRASARWSTSSCRSRPRASRRSPSSPSPVHGMSCCWLWCSSPRRAQRTAPLALNYLITSDVLPWGPLMAGAVTLVGAADDSVFRCPALHGCRHDCRVGQGLTKLVLFSQGR